MPATSSDRMSEQGDSGSEVSSDSDSTDSEESVYSGLEEEDVEGTSSDSVSLELNVQYSFFFGIVFKMFDCPPPPPHPHSLKLGE